MRFELELRNLPLARLGEYLAMAGGTLDGPRRAYGSGWSATITAQEPIRIGVITVPWDLLVIEGDDEAEVTRVHAFMRRQTMRGGG